VIYWEVRRPGAFCRLLPVAFSPELENYTGEAPGCPEKVISERALWRPLQCHLTGFLRMPVGIGWSGTSSTNCTWGFAQNYFYLSEV